MNRIAFLLLAIFPLVALAEDADVRPPKPPFVVNAPANASWVVTYKSKRKPASETGDGPSPQILLPEITKLEVTKAGPVRRMVTTWSTGEHTEKWIIPGFRLEEQLGQDGIYMTTSHESSAESDFPEFSWLSEKNYTKGETYGKKICWAFQAATSVGAPDPWKKSMVAIMQSESGKKGDKAQPPKPTPPVYQTAWIDTDSKLPAALDDGIKTLVYTFQAAPTQAPEMPERFAKMVRDHQNKQSEQLRRYTMPE